MDNLGMSNNRLCSGLHHSAPSPDGPAVKQTEVCETALGASFCCSCYWDVCVPKRSEGTWQLFTCESQGCASAM